MHTRSYAHAHAHTHAHVLSIPKYCQSNLWEKLPSIPEKAGEVSSGNDVVKMAEAMSKVYVNKHAELAQKTRSLHRARTLLELMW